MQFNVYAPSTSADIKLRKMNTTVGDSKISKKIVENKAYDYQSQNNMKENTPFGNSVEREIKLKSDSSAPILIKNDLEVQNPQINEISENRVKHQS